MNVKFQIDTADDASVASRVLAAIAAALGGQSPLAVVADPPAATPARRTRTPKADPAAQYEALVGKPLDPAQSSVATIIAVPTTLYADSQDAMNDVGEISLAEALTAPVPAEPEPTFDPPLDESPLTLDSLDRESLCSAFRALAKQRGLDWLRGIVGPHKSMSAMPDDAIRAALAGVDLDTVLAK